MSSFAISGRDTLTLNDRVFTDLADGDVSVVTFSNDLTAIKTGKDGNTIYNLNAMGENCELVLRLVRGSDDDKYLNSQILSMKSDFPSFDLITGSFIKKVGDGNGNVTNDEYSLEGGVFKINVGAKENVEGDTESSVAVYTIQFATGNRAMG